MFKTTTIASAAALALGTLGATAHAADYKGPDLKGETITITCPWTGAEEGFFKKVVANFEKATGATVKHSCSQSSEQQIVIDIKAGSPSNISVFPQPGLAANMAAIGGLVPLGDKARDWVKTNYAAGSSWADLGTYKGKDGKSNFYGLFFNVNVKSLVWYIPENFKEKGYKVPKTMEELQDLTKEDFIRILTEPKNSLTRQYEALMQTEGVELVFTEDAVASLASYAFQVNQTTQNIGARRLYTIMERLLEDLSFEADTKTGRVLVNSGYVQQRLEELSQDEDLSRFIL